MKTAIAAAAAGVFAALSVAGAASATGVRQKFYAEDGRTGVANGTYEYGASTGTTPTFPVYVDGRLTADFGDECHVAYYTARIEDAKPTWNKLATGCGLTSETYSETITVSKIGPNNPAIKVCWALGGVDKVTPHRNCGAVDILTAPVR